MQDIIDDLAHFQLSDPPHNSTPTTSGRPPRHQKGELFLKGPIPMLWLERAAQLPGHALHVAVAIWFQAGLKNKSQVSISLSRLQHLGAERDSARRGLAALEDAGLISVVRHVGRKPIITILQCGVASAEPEAK